MAVSVLIVDDHDGFRAFARALLESEGFDVVGEAEDGRSALRAVEQFGPDLVLLDVQLPDIDGFEVAQRLAADAPPTAVVLVSTRDAASYRRRLAETSAQGFISKEELSGATLAAVLAT
jgi:two-component system, NarL family, nitrate/nitrite response regulator NarL